MKQVTKGAQWTPKPAQGAPSKGPYGVEGTKTHIVL